VAFRRVIATEQGTPIENLAADTPPPPLTCEQKLAKDWTKLSQPEYAIGQTLIARSDYETLQDLRIG
jgi:hypothetical protein